MRNKYMIKMILLLGLIMIVLESCQTPNEPEIVIKDVTVTIKIEDQSGNPISNVQVQYANQANASDSLLSPFGQSGATDNTGSIFSTFTVPNNGKYITIKLTPSADDASLANINPVVFNQVKIPCQDTSLRFILEKQILTLCNTTIEDIAVQPISICYLEKSSETIFSPLMAPQCTEKMQIEVSDFSLIPNASVIIHKASAPGVKQVSPFTLDPGDKFEIGMLYTASYLSSPMKTENITVNITPANSPKYQYTSIKFMAESKCASCACPENHIVYYPNPQNFVKFCLAEPMDFDINMSEVYNSSQECKIKYSLEKGFTNSNIKIISFNGIGNAKTATLNPGNSLQRMRLNAVFYSEGEIIDEAIYSVQIIDNNGDIQTCSEKLKVVVRLTAESPECTYDMVNSSIFAPLHNSTQSTVLLTEGIGISNSPSGNASVIIKNPNTKCNLIIDKLEIAGDRPFYFLDNSGNKIGKSYGPIAIEPLSSKTIWIGFQPDEVDYDRNNLSGNGPKTEFNGSLIVYSNSPQCKLDQLPLKGKIVYPGFNDICITEYGKNGLNVGIYLGYKGDITATPSISKDFSLYFDGVNLNLKTANLKASGPSAGQYYVKFKVIANNENIESVQDIRDFAIKYAEELGTLPNEIQGVIHEKDLIHITYSWYVDGKPYEYNALMYIYEIGKSDGTNPFTPRVCFSFCVGV